jgi:hypothetical protein
MISQLMQINSRSLDIAVVDSIAETKKDCPAERSLQNPLVHFFCVAST